MGLMDFLGGGDGGFGAASRANEANRRLFQNIRLPEYAQLIPELYNNESFNYELLNEDPALKSAQMQALAKMAGLAEDGLSAEDAAGFAKARDMGAQMARGEREAAMQSAQARGVGGGGLEFAMREIANQGGAQRAQNAGLEQAAQSARQRALYNQAHLQGLGDVRGQDYRANSANTDIINRFNQMNTQQRNQTGMANVDKREDAFRYNEGIKDKNYNNQMRRAEGLAGINNRQGEIGAAQSEAERRRRAGLVGLIGAGAGAYLGGAGNRGTGALIGSQVGSTLGGW